LMWELEGRRNFGEGVLWIAVYEANKVYVLNPRVLTQVRIGAIKSAFEKVASRPVRSIYDEVTQPDRRELDNIIFDVLGLTQGERDAVYEAVVELVRKRLEKAGSLDQ